MPPQTEYNIWISGQKFVFTKAQLETEPGNSFLNHYRSKNSRVTTNQPDDLVLYSDAHLFKLIEAHLRGYKVLPIPPTCVPYMTEENVLENLKRDARFYGLRKLEALINGTIGTGLGMPVAHVRGRGFAPNQPQALPNLKEYKLVQGERKMINFYLDFYDRGPWSLTENTIDAEGYSIYLNKGRAGESCECPREFEELAGQDFQLVCAWMERSHIGYPNGYRWALFASK